MSFQGSGSIDVSSEQLGNALHEVMMAPDISPGDDVSYQTCKTLFLYHPLGWKMVCAPLQLALAEPRQVTVPNAPGSRALDAYLEQWEEIGADASIFQVAALSRIYGIASVGLLIKGQDPGKLVDPFDYPELDLSVNIYDPLNTSGSLVLNQNPMALDFQWSKQIAVQSTAFHRTRAVTLMNEFPVYISYTNSAFGFVGRSVYQRAFYPMKSYLKSMITDDMIETKVGVLVAKIKSAGPVANAVMRAAAAFKRNVVKEAETHNVINIGIDEDIASLNLQNIDAPHTLARRNILENIATSADMPIKLLAQEAFVEGFGEGTEDAKAIARYIERVRRNIAPVVKFFDNLAMYRAWTERFYEGVQKDFPEAYANMPFREAFYSWRNSFTAEWPSLLKEAPAEEIKVSDVKLRAVIALIQVFEPLLDTENKLTLYNWATDSVNSEKIMFASPLEFDFEALGSHLDEQEQQATEQHDASVEGMKAAAGGGEGEGGANIDDGQGGEVKVKLGKADSALITRFDKAAALLRTAFPEAENTIPIDRLRKSILRNRK